MTKSGGKSQVHFISFHLSHANFIDSTRLESCESSHFSSRVITRSIPSYSSVITSKGSKGIGRGGKAFHGGCVERGRDEGGGGAAVHSTL